MTLHESSLPEEVTAEQAERRLLDLLPELLRRLHLYFATRGAVSAPAVLAGIGIAVHQATGRATSGRQLSQDELVELLDSVRWERETCYWDGIAASANAQRTLSFGGGAKDSGGRVADALLHPDTEQAARSAADDRGYGRFGMR
ncbi:hypothetical protein OG339_11845 [Streptosporangium sp. NBC_01495]|uniref:hypothetical protein n=1 Tax=Streptosporangium sp. NBC_01495 TaxID=2903899 RepID=UPI002E34F61A|nr:hypothetical protein [Streptosporangium sp. NBC_01495]